MFIRTPGLGLHLKSLAANLPGHDLHEQHRSLASLDEYDHLRRLFRLCHVHANRNIKKTAVPEAVKNKMRSLICIKHHDFEGCLRDISTEGGKAGAGKNSNIYSTMAIFAHCYDYWL